MLEKEFIPYQQSLDLKELGFNERCLGFYNGKGDTKLYFNNRRDASGDFTPFVKNERLTWFGVPTFSQAFRWFRENYKLYPEIGLHDREDEQTWRFSISVLGYYELAYNQNVGREPYHKTYEEAELACLIKLIEIVKTKQHDNNSKISIS